MTHSSAHPVPNTTMGKYFHLNFATWAFQYVSTSWRTRCFYIFVWLRARKKKRVDNVRCSFCVKMSLWKLYVLYAAQRKSTIQFIWDFNNFFWQQEKKTHTSRITSGGKRLHFVEQPLNASHFMHVRKKYIYFAFRCLPHFIRITWKMLRAKRANMFVVYDFDMLASNAICHVSDCILTAGKSTINTKRIWISFWKWKVSKDDNIRICLNLQLKHFHIKTFSEKIVQIGSGDDTFTTNRKFRTQRLRSHSFYIFQCIDTTHTLTVDKRYK